MAAFEVLSLDPAVPQIRAPGASDTYTFPRAVELPLGTANGVLYLNGSKVVSSGSALTFDGSSTLALTSPSTFAAFIANAATGANSVLAFQTNSVDTARLTATSGGNLLFAANGTSEQMRLNSTGLGIGTTPQRTLHVFTATAETQVMIESTSEQAVRFTRSGVGNLMFGRDSSNNFVFADGFQFSAATRLLTLTSTGNLGLGVTPGGNYTLQTALSYSAGFKGAVFGLTVAGGSSTEYGSIGWNVRYTNSTNTYNYNISDTANLIRFDAGAFNFLQAPAGSAGAAITFTTRMTLDTSGNLGLGVTPNTWASNARVIQFGRTGALWGISDGDIANLTNNAYFDSVDSRFEYIRAGAATNYRQESGEHRWLNAPSWSGTGSNAISFTQAMTLDASGRLGIGSTSPGQLLVVQAANTAAAPTIQVRDATAGFEARLGVDSANYGWVGSGNASNFAVKSNNTIRMVFPFGGSTVVGTAALATNATDGFLYVPTCAGQPTGTPTTQTGTAPIVVDTTNNKLYFYSGGQWRDAGP
jgi:hypothetical protein